MGKTSEQGIPMASNSDSDINPTRALENFLEKGPNRTTVFGIINKTPLTIDIAFGQIKSGLIGDGYIGDTGVFNFCNSDLPDTFDPDTARGWLIAGQSGSVSGTIGGQKFDDSYPAISASEYYPDMTWTISLSLNKGIVEIEIKKNLKSESF